MEERYRMDVNFYYRLRIFRVKAQFCINFTHGEHNRNYNTLHTL